MKQERKKISVAITLILLILAFVCLYNVTYSYFTSTSNVGGTTTLGSLDVGFLYYQDANTNKVENATTLTLYSADGPISRGVPFRVSLTSGGAALTNLAIQNNTPSTDCYVRFWIDAYVVESSTTNGDGSKSYTLDKTTNYGKYFLLNETNESYFTRSGSSVSGSTCYFIKLALGSSASSSRFPCQIGNQLTLTDLSQTDTVPAKLTGEQVHISISFQAVQKANKAYLSAFGEIGDTKGYYTSWT